MLTAGKKTKQKIERQFAHERPKTLRTQRARHATRSGAALIPGALSPCDCGVDAIALARVASLVLVMATSAHYLTWFEVCLAETKVRTEYELLYILFVFLNFHTGGCCFIIVTVMQPEP